LGRGFCCRRILPRHIVCRDRHRKAGCTGLPAGIVAGIFLFGEHFRSSKAFKIISRSLHPARRVGRVEGSGAVSSPGENADPAQRSVYEKMKEVSRFFGGSPQSGGPNTSQSVAFPLPQTETPAATPPPPISGRRGSRGAEPSGQPGATANRSPGPKGGFRCPSRCREGKPCQGWRLPP